MAAFSFSIVSRRIPSGVQPMFLLQGSHFFYDGIAALFLRVPARSHRVTATNIIICLFISLLLSVTHVFQTSALLRLDLPNHLCR